jgi:hypothetical protein
LTEEVLLLWAEPERDAILDRIRVSTDDAHQGHVFDDTRGGGSALGGSDELGEHDT